MKVCKMCRLWKIQIQFWGYKLSNATWRVLNDFTLSEPYWYKAWVRLRMGNLYIMNAKHKGCKNVSSLLPFTHNHPHFTKPKITHTSQNTKSSTLLSPFEPIDSILGIFDTIFNCNTNVICLNCARLIITTLIDYA